MRAECYDLHVYCDAPKCRKRGEYQGDNKREAHKAARNDGWIIRAKDYCSQECAFVTREQESK